MPNIANFISTFSDFGKTEVLNRNRSSSALLGSTSNLFRSCVVLEDKEFEYKIMDIKVEENEFDITYEVHHEVKLHFVLRLSTSSTAHHLFKRRKSTGLEMLHRLVTNHEKKR